MNIKSILMVFCLSVLSLSFTGCDSGSSSDSAATGPGGASAFAGASITFNPTIDFLAGNNLNYTNTDVDSPFPAAASATAGTYTYVPNATFTAGTLTIVVGTDTIVLEISNFTRSGANVTGFTARSGGQSYPVTVTGTIAAHVSTGSTGAGESTADDIPASMRGTHVLTFHAEGTGISGVPADGTETTFTIGARTLTFDGRTLTNPIFYAGNELEWIFKDGAIWWAVSIAGDGSLNEINVQGPYTGSGNAFYGQYNDRGTDTGGDGTVSVDDTGKFTAGSTFYANVTSKVGPTTVPADTPLHTHTLSQSEPVRFQIANNGDLIIGDYQMIVPFQAASETSVTYVKIDPSGTDTVLIQKDTTTNQPVGVSVNMVRNQTVPAPKTTTVTYTLEPVTAE
jgi:hypothetical protein